MPLSLKEVNVKCVRYRLSRGGQVVCRLIVFPWLCLNDKQKIKLKKKKLDAANKQAAHVLVNETPARSEILFKFSLYYWKFT